LSRPSKDEVFMNVAREYASLTKCLRRKVGAVIVKDGHQITSGYNGPPRNVQHCEDIGGCQRQIKGYKTGEGLWICRALHAEANAILQAARFGPPIEGATLYCTSFPCNKCAEMIIQVGIVEVVAGEDYAANEQAKEYLAQAGVKVRFLERKD